MPTFQFVGRVLPDAFPVNLETPPINISNGKNLLETTLQLTIKNCAIIIEGSSNRYKGGDFGLILVRALHIANSATGLIGFALGVGVRPILDEFIDPDGTHMPILPLEKRLQKHCTVYTVENKTTDTFDAVYRKVATTPALFLALTDLVTGLYQPAEGPIVCARAIETLRNHFSPSGLEPRERWPYLHNALKVTSDYLRPITDISVGPRHGARTSALEGDLAVVSERSWIIMNRALELVMRGVTDLPVAEYPVL